MVEVQQHNQSSQSHNNQPCFQTNGEPALRFKEQPWCGKHNQEPMVAKNVYNYAAKTRNSEKTPMCRVAELGRYHKLKHEYILLDESGPAHKKHFTVKLVLKPGEEYEGHGASIKKAQQSAAENALSKTQLQLPHRKPVKAKNETNPVWLLYSVASQLDMSVYFDEQVEVMPLSSNMPYVCVDNLQSNTVGPNVSNQSYNPMFVHYLNASTGQNRFNNNGPPRLNRPPPSFSQDRNPVFTSSWQIDGNPMNYPPSYQQSINGPAMMNCMPNGIQSMMSRPPPIANNKLNTPPPLIPPFNAHMSTNYNNIHRCSFLLSDRTEHKGQGRTMGYAKVDAALRALSHLRPLLSKMEATLKLEQKSTEIEVATKKANESQQLIDTHLEASQQSEIEEIEDRQSGSDIEDEEVVEAIEDRNNENVEKSEDVEKPEDGNNEDVEKPEDQLKHRRLKPKSVVSQIHECAYRLKMNVEFEVIRESGEPHNRSYMLQCSLSSPQSQQHPIVTVGEGSSKKLAKQNACKLMLEQVDGLDNDAVYLASVIVKQATKRTSTASNGKDSKRKTIIKDIKKDPQYGQHINPISRLIQVMQSRNEGEPIFRLIGEKGQNRYREFVVQVECSGVIQQGLGPNKKLAKRSAAVAMLEEIGYVKPMPQPGKSLLKKRSSDSIQSQIEIGVFDPNDFSTNQRPSQVSPEVNYINFITREPSSPPISDKHTIPSSLETFADIDSEIAGDVGSHQQLRFSSESMSPTPQTNEQMRVRCDSEKHIEDYQQPIRSQRRRVTFSNQVSSLLPPEDANYPNTIIAPLKSEVVLVTKLKKKGRDSKKALTPEEKAQIASACRLFCQLPNGRESRSGYVQNETVTSISPDSEYLEFGQSSMTSPVQPPSTPNAEYHPLNPSAINQQHPLSIATSIIVNNGQPQIDLISPSQLPMDLTIKDSKHCLERLAKQFRFTVSYSDFPKAMNEYFSLVTVGLDKPILCHGRGSSEEQAHNEAAYNAISHLSELDTPKSSIT